MKFKNILFTFLFTGMMPSFLPYVYNKEAPVLYPVYPISGKEIWDPEIKDNYIQVSWDIEDKENEYVYYICRWPYVISNTKMCWFTDTQKSTYVSSPYKVVVWQIYYNLKSTYVPRYRGWEGPFDYVSRNFIYSVNTPLTEDMIEEYVGVYANEGIDEDIGPVVKEEIEEMEETKQIEESVVDIQESSKIASEYVPVEKDIKPKDNTVVVKEIFAWNTDIKNIVKGESAVLGISSEDVVCRYRYVKKKNSIHEDFCNVPKLEILEEYRYPILNDYSILLTGKYVESFKIQVDEYVCAFDILRPSTWFKCEERFEKSVYLDVKPNMFFNIYWGNRNVRILSYSKDGGSFGLVAGHVKSTDGIKLVHRYRVVNGKYGIYRDIGNEYFLNVKDMDSNGSGKPFGYPFSSPIGVTQWYGYTEYQKPHTGIDFGSMREVVLAIGDGQVVEVGWDSYFGECLSGGKYLKVRHVNGMYSVYYHLEDIYVNTGDYVKVGQSVGLSGNTGSWNCQSLGYHLHLETRRDMGMGSHVNPVKYISASWENIPTLGYRSYPGRLSGENPHPGY